MWDEYADICVCAYIYEKHYKKCKNNTAEKSLSRQDFWLVKCYPCPICKAVCAPNISTRQQKNGKKKGGGNMLCLALSSDGKHMYDASESVCLTDFSHAAEMVYRPHRNCLMRQGANKLKHCNSTVWARWTACLVQ